MKRVAENVWQSAQGLTYGPTQEEHRVAHVLNHTADIATEKNFGVFTMNNNQIFNTIDEAWMHIQAVDSHLVGFQDVAYNNTVAYIVDMGHTIGYVGGVAGTNLGFPVTSYINVVLEGTRVITAYPIAFSVP